MAKQNTALKLWHISPDLKVKLCSAQTPETCPYSRSELLQKYDIKIHYESVLRPMDAENLATKLRKIEEKVKSREIFANGDKDDFEAIGLTHGDTYNNFQKIYEHFLTNSDEYGEGKFSGRKPKRLSKGLLKFNSDNGEKYNLVAERMIGTHPDYVHAYVPYLGGQYEDELDNSANYESIEKLEDGGSKILLRDPFKNRPTWVIWKLDKTTTKKELAYHFSGDDIDATFGNFMETGSLEGFDGPRMWSSPKETSPLESQEQINDVLSAVTAVERNLNPKFKDHHSVLEMHEHENGADFTFKGNLSDGLTPTQVVHRLREARFRNPKGQYTFTYDVIDDKQKNSENGWNASWGIKQREDGSWIFRGRPNKDDYYEEILEGPEDAKHLINVFENKHYESTEDKKPSFNGEYIAKLMNTIDREISNKPEAFSHYRYMILDKEPTTTIFEEEPKKKKKGFLSLFS